MSETNTAIYETNREAWNRVGEAWQNAGRLYLSQLTATLDLSRNLQKELLLNAWGTTQLMTRLGEDQLGFWLRLRQSLPSIADLPTGPATISGMVDEIVKETTKPSE